ncbi:MAG: helix-turn-helix transcriptional regulator [Oscillospiraceae bacterium]|nr:helix-turn-helix transcriptional regulator [Oscillospiraceae bacterium]
MEFGQKLQQLRKQKGLTQEELAALLYVSRAAVSKWESGRGYPNIDSLRALAKCFSVTVDALLSGEEVLHLAEEETRQTARQTKTLVFGLLDLGCLLLAILPLFGQREGGAVRAVSLLNLTAAAPWLRTVSLAAVLALVLTGVLLLALKRVRAALWEKGGETLSLVLSAAGTLLFIVSRQPYVAAMLFVFLMIKVFLCVKQP